MSTFVNSLKGNIACALWMVFMSAGLIEYPVIILIHYIVI